jgi:hypothetical protein
MLNRFFSDKRFLGVYVIKNGNGNPPCSLPGNTPVRAAGDHVNNPVFTLRMLEHRQETRFLCQITRKSNSRKKDDYVNACYHEKYSLKGKNIAGNQIWNQEISCPRKLQSR